MHKKEMILKVNPSSEIVFLNFKNTQVAPIQKFSPILCNSFENFHRTFLNNKHEKSKWKWRHAKQNNNRKENNVSDDKIASALFATPINFLCNAM